MEPATTRKAFERTHYVYVGTAFDAGTRGRLNAGNLGAWLVLIPKPKHVPAECVSFSLRKFQFESEFISELISEVVLPFAHMHNVVQLGQFCFELLHSRFCAM